MPRTQRLIIHDQSTAYHVMSRTALDGLPLADIEKDFMWLHVISPCGCGHAHITTAGNFMAIPTETCRPSASNGT